MLWYPKKIIGEAYLFVLSINITTNLNAEELKAHYGGLVRSRLREMFNLVNFNHDSVDKRK